MMSCKIIKSNFILSEEALEGFLLESRAKQGCPLLPTTLHYYEGCSCHHEKTEGNKRNKTRSNEVNYLQII